MLIADECAERAQLLAVHFIEISGLIGHCSAHASQVHTLAVKPALQHWWLRLGQWQRAAWRGGELGRNWYGLLERRTRQRQWVGQKGGLFDVHDFQPACTDETAVGRKLKLFLQRNERNPLANLWAGGRLQRLQWQAIRCGRVRLVHGHLPRRLLGDVNVITVRLEHLI